MSDLRPTAAQLAWQQLELGMFVHVGVNTFAGREWSDGTLPAASFDPTALDAGQWVAAAQAMGARYLVLTAKHHDGFCLWPTATTDYSVASSPWRDGRGDLVAEVAEACRAAGLVFGVYLSPWDRHEPRYADPPAYDAFYTAQLRELCTRYGPLGEIWFDGAGSAGRVYDWDAIMAVVEETQPDAMVFTMGRPTIRWVGNEDGLAGDPVHYVTDRTDLNSYDDDVTHLGRPRYLPPECDVSLRRGWFWAAEDEPKSLDHLLAIHYRSVGRGANLLLNVPPDDRGLVPDADVARLRAWRAELDRCFGRPVAAALELVAEDGDRRTWAARLPREVRLDHLRLREDYREGQRVEGHVVRAGTTELASGLTIGHQRVHACAPLTTATLEVETVGAGARLVSLEVFDTGGAAVPEPGYVASTDEPT
ncbi:alpha-L-fucosidase [Microlunatus capsulatus]|uniref:alpha-L-fucosidase n=1 Tax=Microlunatus capsulatus TaxID=99117 RepID=A0ABS4Z3H2_9ACTN|nr:alpha-L-fucosidase [Microlunatus capsulatus]MBP2415583.1 alpha-L-fucosidase [Microlunatus capsulatus]